MFGDDLTLVWNELLAVQETIHSTCNNVHEECAIDKLYQREWYSLCDFIDVSVSNISVMLSNLQENQNQVDYTEQDVIQAMYGAIEAAAPTASALLEGHIYALANCTIEDTFCPLRQRAQTYLLWRGDNQIY